jgi:DNA-binding GntR family transcriptional regulator
MARRIGLQERVDEAGPAERGLHAVIAQARGELERGAVELRQRRIAVQEALSPAAAPETRLDEVVREQRTLLQAIGDNDGAAAERAAAQHVLTFERAIRQVI